MHLVVIIPAYNESQVIGDVLRSLPNSFSGVTKVTPVVIDDNSSDNTSEVARSMGALCVRHEANLGAGGATITGFEVAKHLQADVVVTMDGDGQHAGEDLHELIAPVVAREADVVIGSRLLRQAGNMPKYKILGNNLMNIVTFAFFRIWVSDSQSGYKAFSQKAINMIELKTSGYEFCSEICGEIKGKRLRVREVPIQTIYTDYSKKKGQLALNAVNIILGLILRKVI